MKSFQVYFVNSDESNDNFYIDAPDFLSASQKADKYAKENDLEISSLQYEGEMLP